MNIKFLKDLEAVVCGDTLILQLPSGYYLLDDRDLQVGYSNTQVAITKDTNVYKRTLATKTLSKVVLQDGREVSAQEYNEAQRMYDYGDCYPDLDTEYAHRKFLTELDAAEKVYETTEEQLELLSYTVVGELTDTGSKFIETPLVYGQARFSNYDNAFYKLNVTGLLGEVIQQFAKDKGFKFHNSTHSGYRYCQIDSNYVSSGKWEKLLEGTEHHYNSLLLAKQAEKSYAEDMLDYLKAKYNTEKLSEESCAAVFKQLAEIRFKVANLRVTSKSDIGWRAALRLLDETMSRLGK
jgi:hypothetical protein